MTRLACPSPEVLSAFNLGELPEPALEEVADHMEQCPRCQATVEALDRESDSVVTCLRSMSGADVASGSGTNPAPEPEPTPTPVAALPLPTRIGVYQILGESGRGGMGVIFKAWHTRLQRVVALKVLLGGEFASDDYRARFRAEAEAVARLQHPNIIQIFDIGEWCSTEVGPPVPYLVLEYVDGGSLSTRLGGKPQAPARAAEWLLTLSRAVHYAHVQGIVHRDLKPSNVLLTADGQLKLCDFGVAKQLSGTDLRTLGGLLVGTPEYMAPEQAEGQGRHAGPAADVYALGAILYTMLTGRPMFQSASVLETLEQVRSREPLPPRRLQPDVPRDLETICLKCLNKDPRRRYPSAAALAEDLERFLGGRTILARPAGPLERGWKWARRRPAEALLSAAVVLSTALGFALVAWQWRRAESKAAAATSANDLAQRVRREAIEEQAELAMNQGLTLCDHGEVRHGLLWLAHSLGLITDVGSYSIERALRVNLADWADRLSRSRLEMKHSAEVLQLAFTPDGRTLIATAKDRYVRTFDVDSGRETGPSMVLDKLSHLHQWVGSLAISPRDPRTMITGDEEGHVSFWDLDRRRRVGLPLAHPPGHMVWSMAFSPDGSRLVTCCDDGAARWWDVATRTMIGAPLRHDDVPGYYALALSPDGRTLVTAGKDRRAIRWDVADGRRIDPPLLHESPVSAVAFARDGRKIITGTRDGRLHLWDPESARVTDLTPQGSGVNCLALARDGRTFASGTLGGVVRVWDVGNVGQAEQTYKLDRGVTALAFAPDGRTLATGQDDGMIRLWEVPPPKAIGPPLRMDGPIQHVAFSPDGRRLLIGSNRGARWWDVDRRSPTGPLMHCGRYEPIGMVSSRDGRRTYAVLAYVEAYSLSPDARFLAMARWSGTEEEVRGRAEIWDAQGGERLLMTPEQPAPLVGVAYSPDARSLLTWDASPGSALLWDAANLRESRPLFRVLDEPIRQAAFNRDGRLLLLACRDGTARLWDVAKDEEFHPDCHPHQGYPLTAVAYDPFVPRIVTGCQAGIVRIWDMNRGALLQDVRGNAGAIAAIAFSANGKVILSGSHDGTARFWDVESGRQLGPSLRQNDAVLCVAFHPDGRSAAIGTKGGTARLWHVPSPPRTGDVRQIRLWVEGLTGQKFGELTAPTLSDDAQKGHGQ
jgi:WD40 repeat protein